MIMKSNTTRVRLNMQSWLTINEAINVAKQTSNINLTHSGIYRHALCGDILLSIYFQSPITLRKLSKAANKSKLRLIHPSFVNRICFLEKNCFTNNRNLILSTEGKYFNPSMRILDTKLNGYEYVLIQRLLAYSLGIPQPITGANEVNYGITVIFSGETFQIFEKMTWSERIQQQLIHLPKNLTQDINEFFISDKFNKLHNNGYFPIHSLPSDACFVVKYTELEKLIQMSLKNTPGPTSTSATRISTPLSRLLWLACKNNENISPLLKKPYKLLSIFEQWALAEGITDRLSGDTLKNALERGSPH